jgi:hypothetical protein
MSAYTHTIFPGYVPDGFFDNDNIEFLRAKIASVLKREYVQNINVDRDSVIRIMQRIIGERLEPVVRMNQRVVMTICNEFRLHQDQARKHANWEEHYIESQRLYDPTTERGPDLQNIKLANRLGNERVGGTMRFIFI